MTIKTLNLGIAALLLATSTALAAPCSTSDKGKTPDGSNAANSSAADKSSKNEAGGNQPASPGTVGAMNNAGASASTGGQQASTDKGKEDPGAKNTAGGNQPASPGTVGAMNNTTGTQPAGKDDNC